MDIPEFTLLRRDRKSENDGGVCAYIKASRYKYKLLSNLNCCDDHECLWIHLRPNRLPRGIPCITIAVIYHPPSADEKLMQDHLFQTLTLIETEFPNCGVILTMSRAVARTLIGRGCIFIYSGSARLASFEINFISKETSWAEPEYMNIHPPN